MSTTYYNQKWETAISKLLENVAEQNLPLEQNKAEKGINYKRSDYEWFQYYGALYLRYLEIYRDLEDSFDQMTHPQKRALMKEMLENVIVRLCEVKQNVIKFSKHTTNPNVDYVNLDQIIMDLKLTPKALNLPLPRHFLDPTPRDQVVKTIQKELGVTQEVEVVADTVTLDTNMETAIRIIQKLQRGRQGIVRGLTFSKLRSKAKDHTPQASNQQDQRPIIIQKYWRAFLARKQLNKMRQDELKFLGIQKDPIHKNLLEQAEKQRQNLKVNQRIREEKFIGDKDLVRQQLKKVEEPSIKQKMLDQRRKWIKKFMEVHQFSNVPTSAAQFYKDKELEETAQKEVPKAKPERGKQPKDGKAPKKTDIEKFIEERVAIGPTEAVVKLQENVKKYTQTWGNRDQTQVSEQVYDSQLAKAELRPGLEAEMQQLVDGMINLELDGMRIKYGIKVPKKRKPKKKAKKVKKVKIPQGLSKRQPKEILQQLYEKNIAKVLNPAKFAEIIGEHNTVTHLIEKSSPFLPDPSISQIKNIVSEYVGLPLGCQAAKEKLEKWSWFLFYGAMGTGKTMAVRALQTQTNAVLFDLTPDCVKERYSEKAELVRLIWSVIICAKEFQPSIIMVDDFQTIFSAVKTKKKDGSASFGPKMKKIIGDLKKNKLWTKTDRISVICCTNKPYDATLKDCKKLFDKQIYFPFPNYATRKQIAKCMIEAKVGRQLTDFPYETLAHSTEGFTAGSFKQCIQKVLTPMRIQRLKDEPLRLGQFINPLSNSICVFAGQYQKFRKFTEDVLQLKGNKQGKEADEKKKDKIVEKKPPKQ